MNIRLGYKKLARQENEPATDTSGQNLFTKLPDPYRDDVTSKTTSHPHT